jgi:hypothetical protein
MVMIIESIMMPVIKSEVTLITQAQAGSHPSSSH